MSSNNPGAGSNEVVLDDEAADLRRENPALQVIWAPHIIWAQHCVSAGTEMIELGVLAGGVW